LKRSQGGQVWLRFNGGKTGSLWYYRSLVQIFQQREHSGLENSPMVTLLDEVVTQIEQLAGEEER
jgi:hypothetical protein